VYVALVQPHATLLLVSKTKTIKDIYAVRSGGTMPPNLAKDVMLLADRARSQRVREGTASTASRRMLSRPATSAAMVCDCHFYAAALIEPIRTLLDHMCRESVSYHPLCVHSQGHTGRLTPQQWAPAPCSIACTSFR